MTRREALRLVLAVTGSTTVFGARRFLAAEPVPAAPAASPVTLPETAFLDEVAETILPTTPDSPGARAAGVGAFMHEIVRAFYDHAEQVQFAEAPALINGAATALFGREFLALAPKARTEVLLDLEKLPDPNAYRMLKQLSLWGYFTSEVGMTQALAYQPVPVQYHGCLPLEPGQKAWAE